MENEILCSTIKVARMAKRMTQEELAEKIEITAKHMSQIESGRSAPSLKALYLLAKTLNFSVDDVFFPESSNGAELRRKVERRLRECTESELHIICATV